MIKRLFLILFFIFPLCTHFLFGQQYNIQGIIVSLEGIPIPYCNISAKETSDPSNMYGAVTKDDGSFTFTVHESTYEFNAAFIGYEKYSQELSVSGDVNMGQIILIQSTTNLDEVVIKPDMIIRRPDGFLFLPSGAATTLGRNSMDVLNYVPSVFINRANNTISINGKSEARVMVNNRMLNLTGDELSSYLESINADDIKSIEVIADAGSQYDADIQGGIIKISMKRNTVQGLKGSVSANYDFQDEANPTRANPSLNMEFNRKQWDVYGHFSYTRRDFRQEMNENIIYYGNDREIDNEFYGKNPTNRYIGRLGTNYAISNNQTFGAELEWINTNGKSTNTTNSVIRHLPSQNGNAQTISGNNNESDRYNVSLNYNFLLDEKGTSLFLIADYMNFSSEDKQTDILSETYEGDTNIDKQRNETQRKTDYYTFRADFNKKLTTRYSFNTGIKYAYTKMDTELDYESYITDTWTYNTELSDHYLYREGVFSAFASLSGNYDRINYKIGLRMENTDLRPRSYIRPDETRKQNYTDFFPSASVIYHLNKEKKNMLMIGYTRSVNRPGFSQLNPYRFPLNNYAYVIGNPDLKPAYTNNIYFNAILHNSYSLSLGYNQSKGMVNQLIFKNEDNDEILYYQFANMDRSDTYFLSINAPFKPLKWWNSSANLNFGYANNKEKEETFKGAYFMGRINNSFVLPANWFLEANFMYYSGGVMSIWDMKSYNMLDVVVKKGFLNNRLMTTVSVNNLLDDGSAIMKGTTDQADFYKKYRQRNGNMARTYRISVIYNFKIGKDIKVKKIQAGNSEERNR